MNTPPFRPKRLAALVACTLLPMAAFAQSGLTELGSLTGPTGFSNAFGVSADGSVVVGQSSTAFTDPMFGMPVMHAVRWVNGTPTDLGSLNGNTGTSRAHGVSGDGGVVVGSSDTTTQRHAFRWSGGTMTDLGSLSGANGRSTAWGVSADGSVVVGESDTASDTHAFRWVGGTMTDLGVLGAGYTSSAKAASSNGSVVVGSSATANYAGQRAFRWVVDNGGVNGTMTNLGVLSGGSNSQATGVSADGSVVVGYGDDGSNNHAFHWVVDNGGVNGTMTDLGALMLGGSSFAHGVSGDGNVVVGLAGTANGDRAFRWTSGVNGMETVEDWLTRNGVTVANGVTTLAANATNCDGSVVVGELYTGAAFTAFIARVGTPSCGGSSSGSSGGNGLITLEDVQRSLSGASLAGNTILASANTVINGAHSRPLSRRVNAGQDAFWLAGDWGTDDHGNRRGDLGLAEVGVGRHFGPVQVNAAIGQTWASQNQVLNGKTKADGTYLLAEALVPLSGNLWGVLGGYGQWGKADLRRGYLNAGLQDYSVARPDTQTWSVRARLEWDKAYRLADATVSPYADLSYGEAKLDAYTENGGGFPARFDARKEKATELRLGANAEQVLGAGVTLLGTLEAVHRFEKTGARTSGQMLGLFAFNLDGQKQEQDWLRLGVGVEGKLGDGIAALSINATTKGETANAWVAASWRRAF